MAQHDFVIDDQNGLSFLADLNDVLAAIVSNNSGATEPAETYPYQWWADTSTGILKIRNAADSAWVSVFNLATGVPVDAELSALAGLTSAANKVPMFSGAGTATLLDFKDEDNMASDSATAVPSQKSVKAYVDANGGGVQIQAISASVAANSLTISAPSLTLDFRSTTLGSGTVTTVSGTPASLVISSGSTLGTVNGIQSDIAVLAINNAGTIELAAVNMAGGVDLSETGLISTTAEGGAGAADSATVIYSTTARTNVAYRVIGIIRSTQATAGTWATAPSLIQGAGGNALTSMSSAGYRTEADVTGSRSKATTYYNTTGYPKTVTISATGSGTSTFVIINVNGRQHYGSAAGSASGPIAAFAIVPPGKSYSVNEVNGTATIASWLEG